MKEKTKLSARNQIRGTVTSIQEGAVNGIVKMAFGNHTVSSTISMNAIADLELAAGKEASIIVKSTSVMMMVED